MRNFFFPFSYGRIRLRAVDIDANVFAKLRRETWPIRCRVNYIYCKPTNVFIVNQSAELLKVPRVEIERCRYRHIRHRANKRYTKSEFEQVLLSRQASTATKIERAKLSLYVFITARAHTSIVLVCNLHKKPIYRQKVVVCQSAGITCAVFMQCYFWSVCARQKTFIKLGINFHCRNGLKLWANTWVTFEIFPASYPLRV